jgi:hypothetical protein
MDNYNNKEPLAIKKDKKNKLALDTSLIVQLIKNNME